MMVCVGSFHELPEPVNITTAKKKNHSVVTCFMKYVALLVGCSFICVDFFPIRLLFCLFVC